MKRATHGWKIAAGLAVSLVFVALALYNIDLGRVAEAFRQTQPLWLLPGSVLILLSYLLRSLLWRQLLGPRHPTRLWNLFRIITIGYFANNILPLKLGEVLRAWLLSKKEGCATSLAVGTVVVERVTDLFALLFYFLLMMFVQPFPHWLKLSGLAIAGLGVVFLSVMIVNYLVGGHLVKALEKPLAALPGRAGPWLHAQIERFLEGLKLIRSPWQLAAILGLSLATWFAWILVTYCSFRALDLSLPLAAAVFLIVVLNFGLMIPSSPGGLGVFEYMVILALAPYGVGKAEALSVGVVFHMLQYLLTLALGWLFAMQLNVSMHQAAALESGAGTAAS